MKGPLAVSKLADANYSAIRGLARLARRIAWPAENFIRIEFLSESSERSFPARKRRERPLTNVKIVPLRLADRHANFIIYGRPMNHNL